MADETDESDLARWGGRLFGGACLLFAAWVTVRGLLITGPTTEFLVSWLLFAGVPTIIGGLFFLYPARGSRLVLRAVSWLAHGDW